MTSSVTTSGSSVHPRRSWPCRCSSSGFKPSRKRPQRAIPLGWCPSPTSSPRSASTASIPSVQSSRHVGSKNRLRPREEAAVTTISDDVFNVGFALSGAISAGAYTAGVLDYFFQALNAWEQARSDPDAPRHHVTVQVITGASAGAIAGALGVVALARGIRPQTLSADEKSNAKTTPGSTSQDLRCVLPSLYDTWVVRPRMV